MQYEQLGIPGLADNKLLCQNRQSDEAEMLRPKLYEYIRDTLRKTESEFARMLSVSPATVTYWLYSKRMPRGAVLVRMPSVLGLTCDEILQLFATS